MSYLGFYRSGRTISCSLHICFKARLLNMKLMSIVILKQMLMIHESKHIPHHIDPINLAKIVPIAEKVTVSFCIFIFSYVYTFIFLKVM